MSAIRDTFHWLTFPQRVTFKLCLTMYKCLHGLAPPYLTRFSHHVVAGRTQLRSADQHKLFVPRTSTSTLGPRAFCSPGPSSWNALPRQLRDPATPINIFRQSLKTYLFTVINCVTCSLGTVAARAFVSVTRPCFTSQHDIRPARPRPRPIFWSQTGFVLRPTVLDHVTASDR